MYKTVMLYLGSVTRLTQAIVKKNCLQIVSNTEKKVFPHYTNAREFDNGQNVTELIEWIKEYFKREGIEHTNLSICLEDGSIALTEVTIGKSEIDEINKINRSQEMYSTKRERYLTTGAFQRQTVFKSIIDLQEYGVLNALERAGFHTHYLTVNPTLMLEMKSKDIKGFYIFDGIATLCLFGKQGYKVIPVKESLLIVASDLAERFNVSLESVIQLIREVGIIKAPIYSEKIRHTLGHNGSNKDKGSANGDISEDLGSPEEVYYSKMERFNASTVKILGEMLDTATKQSSGLKVQLQGMFSDINGMLIQSTHKKDILVNGLRPDEVEIETDVDATKLRSEDYVMIAFGKSVYLNSLNFKDSVPITNSEDGETSEGVAAEVGTGAIEKPKKPSKVKTAKQELCDGFSKASNLPITKESQKQPVEQPGSDQLSSKQQVTLQVNEEQIRSSLHNELQKSKHYKFSLKTEATRDSEEIKVLIKEMKETQNAMSRIKQKNLGTSLFMLGLAVLSVGVIGYTGIVKFGERVPVQKQLTALRAEKSSLSAKQENLVNVERLESNTFSSYIPYIEYIGEFTDGNVVVEDFNIISDQSLQLSGTSSNEDNFRKFKEGLESLSLEMDVVLISSERTNSNHTFVFEISQRKRLESVE